MTKYNNAFTEVYVILENLDEEDYNKIPPEVIEAIRTNRNEEYQYELDEDLELKEQSMLPQTKAILFNLFRDYLSTPEQKEKIIKMQKEERQRNEFKKQQLYNSDVFENKKIEEQKTSENLNIIKYKESTFKKFINFIKRIFGF